MFDMIVVVLIAVAYLLGSVSTAIISCRLLGLPDPRTTGSGNPGATNVLRTGTRAAAAITLLGDMLKGFIPMLVGHALSVPAPALGSIGLAALLGHIYPLYYGFRGGKGVATGLGVLLGMNSLVGVLTMTTWALTAALFRISSVAALVAILLAPFYAHWIMDSVWLTATTIVMTLLIYWQHRSNIRNLLAGTEQRIGKP